MDPVEAVFTPDTEPYLGRQAVFHFDEVIQSALEQQVALAEQSHALDLSALQVATCELAPGACSLALSIRELIRQAYLFPAMVLLRPLVERVGTLSHLVQNPDAVEVWHRGWSYAERPRLPVLLSAMLPTPGLPNDTTRLIAGRYHELVHGGPDAARESFVEFPDGSAGFVIGKDLHSPDRADAVAVEATMYLIVLMARTAQVFP